VTIITFEVLDAGQKILMTDKAKLTVIETSLVGWFDETHPKCTVGGRKADQSKRYTVRFP
jgi:hypothetical protein